jgi:hypothetical protein
MGFFMGEENAGESKWSPWRWDCDFNGVDAMGGEYARFSLVWVVGGVVILLVLGVFVGNIKDITTVK